MTAVWIEESGVEFITFTLEICDFITSPPHIYG